MPGKRPGGAREAPGVGPEMVAFRDPCLIPPGGIEWIPPPGIPAVRSKGVVMDTDTQKLINRRLRRAEGQVAGISRMIEEQEACVDVLMQISAVRGALGKIAQMMLANHLDTCVASAIESGDKEARREHIDEITDLFGRFGALAGR